MLLKQFLFKWPYISSADYTLVGVLLLPIAVAYSSITGHIHTVPSLLHSLEWQNSPMYFMVKMCRDLKKASLWPGDEAEKN